MADETTILETSNPLGGVGTIDLLSMSDVDCGRFLSQTYSPDSLLIQSHVAPSSSNTTPKPRIGVIPITGILTKYGSEYGSSTDAIGNIVQDAANSGLYDGLMLRADSPGGSTAGIYESNDKIAAAAKKIPIHAYVDGLAASAAIPLIAPAARISISKGSLMGSVGTYSSIDDTSEMFSKAGVKRTVVKAGEHKAAGLPGTQVTDTQIAERQKIVDAMNDHFVSALASGRGISIDKARSLADGKVHVGQAAVDLGFADAVSTFDQALNELANVVNARRSQKGTKAMSEQSTPVAATLTELKAAFSAAGSEFILSQLEAGATMAQAQHKFELHQKDAEIAKLKSEHEAAFAAKAESEKKATQRGVDPVSANGATTNASGDGTFTDQWNAAIDEKVASKKVTRQQAVVMVVKENPQLQQAYIEEYRQRAAQRS